MGEVSFIIIPEGILDQIQGSADFMFIIISFFDHQKTIILLIVCSCSPYLTFTDNLTRIASVMHSTATTERLPMEKDFFWMRPLNGNINQL